MDYDEFENLIQDIAQQLFKKGKYYLNIVLTKRLKRKFNRYYPI